MATEGFPERVMSFMPTYYAPRETFHEFWKIGEVGAGQVLYVRCAAAVSAHLRLQVLAACETILKDFEIVAFSWTEEQYEEKRRRADAITDTLRPLFRDHRIEWVVLQYEKDRETTFPVLENIFGNVRDKFIAI